MNPREPNAREPMDPGLPLLLLVSLTTVLAGVVGVTAVATSGSGLAVVGALVVVLTGLVIVIRTMGRQLGDSDGH